MRATFIHPVITISIVIALFALQATAQAPRSLQGQALDERPESRIEASQSIDAALAAALIGAISGQFDERKVAVKLDRVATEPLSLVDLRVEGDGRLRIGDDEEWLPLRFSAMYDSVGATVVQPRLTIGDEGEGEEVAIASPLAQSLRDQVAAGLQREFAQQPARLHIDRVRQLPAGRRYARLEGVGTVDFDEYGSSVATIRALYDRDRHEWLQVGYELGAAATASPAQATPVDSR